jgi:hypothetical protein
MSKRLNILNSLIGYQLVEFKLNIMDIGCQDGPNEFEYL